MSSRAMGASTNPKSLTVATAPSSRAKPGVDAEKSMSTAPGCADWTNPPSSKYASSSADCEVQNVMMALASSISAQRSKPAFAKRTAISSWKFSSPKKI